MTFISVVDQFVQQKKTPDLTLTPTNRTLAPTHVNFAWKNCQFFLLKNLVDHTQRGS